MDKLLIVDDIELSREILAHVFSDSYEIIEASNGKRAIEIVDETPDITAILLDIVMPEMSGIDVLRELAHRNILATVPVFVITAEHDEDLLAEAFDLGAVDVITKPFNIDFIRRRIGHIIELYDHRAGLETILNKQLKKFYDMQMGFLEMAASTIEFRDRKAGNHIKRIYEITKILMEKYSKLHHERKDNRGSPDGLKDEEFSLWAQIVSIADVYDELVSPRVYEEQFSTEKAAEMINNGECGIFNPELLEVFNAALPEILEIKQ